MELRIVLVVAVMLCGACLHAEEGVPLPPLPPLPPADQEPSTPVSPRSAGRDTGRNAAEQNIAQGKPSTQSSEYVGTGVSQGPQLGNDGKTEGRDPHALFHTKLEENPWWQVDLKAVFTLSRVRLYNRINYEIKARTIQVLVSLDGSKWEKAYAHDGTEWKVLDCEMNGRQARFVRVQLAERNYLHLFEVEVYGH